MVSDTAADIDAAAVAESARRYSQRPAKAISQSAAPQEADGDPCLERLVFRPALPLTTTTGEIRKHVPMVVRKP
jgi:hypothetical protein